MDTTVVKALSVLETLAASDAPLGVTELATSLGLSKSNAHRLLQTLSSRGYVIAVDHRYAASTRLWELGTLVVGRLEVTRIAAPIMQRLVAEVDETAHLSILDMATCEVVSIHNVESTQPVRAYSRIGQRTPAHCVATGKALLSVQPLDTLSALPDELPKFTRNTLYRRDDLLRALKKALGDGYATNFGEWHEQVGGAAAVVYGHTGRPLAALGLTVPVERMRPKVMARYITLLKGAAGEISRLMGAPASPPSSTISSTRRQERSLSR